MIVDKIHKCLDANDQPIDEAILEQVAKLARYSFARQFGPRVDKPKTLRLSSIGKCMRQQAYGLLGYEEAGKEIDSRAKMVFFQGDMTELALVQLAKAAGCNITDCGLEQRTIEIDGIEGHPDGIIHNGKDTLLEVKSMSSFSFSNFQDQQIDESYHYQINAYLHALELEQACIVGLNKDAGVLHEWILQKDQNVVDDIKRRIVVLRKVTKEALPDRPYTPNEKGILPWQCLYCAHWQTCRPKAEKVLVSNRYKLRDLSNETTSVVANDRSSGK
jgi:hypothetical protein